MLTSLCWGMLEGCPHPCAREDAGWVSPSPCGVDVGGPIPTLGGHGGPPSLCQAGAPPPRCGTEAPQDPPQLTGLFPPVRHAALPQLPASAGAAEPTLLDRPHAPGECHPPPQPPSRGDPLAHPPTSLQRSVSDNALVAMDFSGCTGRVIENPNEVLTVALEEAQAWRVSWGEGVRGGTPPSPPSPP